MKLKGGEQIAAVRQRVVPAAKKVGTHAHTHFHAHWLIWTTIISGTAVASACVVLTLTFRAHSTAPEQPPYWSTYLAASTPLSAEGSQPVELASVTPLWPRPVSNPLSNEMIVNKKFNLDANFTPPDLVSVHVNKAGDDPMRKEPAAALERLFAGAQKEGVQFVMNSGFRSYATQQALYSQEIANRGQSGADEFSARPGFSEHQSGLAADVAVPGAGVSTGNAWLAAHAHEYGFIVRYQQGKEAITGYHAEPWHIRYVGKDLAGKLFTSGMAMEEYFAIPGGAYAN